MITKPHILTCPDYQHVLHQKSEDVSVHPAKELMETIEVMRIILRKSAALGLAAPQIGVPLRLFITAWDEVFINPKLERGHTTEMGLEGCLSIPGKAYKVRRAVTVKVNGKQYSGLTARVIQHEYDHLDGILISDTGDLVLT